MKKKIRILMSIIIFMTAGLLGVSAKAADAGVTVVETGEIGENASYSLTSDGVLTISGTGDTYDYNPTGNTYSPLGYLSDHITSVVIKSGIESIGSNLFNTLDKLVKVSIPSSVTRIEPYAFIRCHSLGEVKIPASVTYIGAYAFYDSGISGINIPVTVTYIGECAFDECPNLEVIPGVLNENIRYTLNKTTGEFIFTGKGEMPNYNVVYNVYPPYKQYKKYVKKVIIGEGITSVGSCGFWEFHDVESVELPSTLTKIGSCAFQQNYKLKEINIPEGVTSIGQQAFDMCRVLPNVTLPSSLEYIGIYAFRECNAFTEVTIPESVTSVGDSVFQDCGSLEKVNWNTNTYIPREMFEECSELKEVKMNGIPTYIGQEAFKNCVSLTSIEIPEGVGSIGSNAFTNDTALIRVILPDTITRIAGAFYGCTALESIRLPENLEVLGANTFDGCVSLSKIAIPSKVTEIGYRAFYNCSKIESLVIPEGVKTIEQYTFFGCSSLEKIEIPDTVTNIGKYAFLLCDNLEEIRILNPSCALQNPSLPDNITIYGYDGSSAQEYAKLFEYPYVSLGKANIDRFSVEFTSWPSYSYSGKEITPAVTVEGLAEGVDYTVAYSDNVNAGTAYVTVTGIGNFTGTKTVSFEIDPLDLSSYVNIEYVNGSSYVYNGSEICPQIIVTSDLDSKELVEGEDYTLAYSNNINKGTGKITITGINNYYSTTYRTFTIQAKPIEEVELVMGKTEYTYTGSVIYPEIVDENGEVHSLNSLTSLGSVILGNNVVNAGAASCTLKGSGNYTGTRTFEYTILPKKLEDYGYYLSQTKHTYTGYEIKPYVSKTNSGPSHTTTITYSDNINAGVGKVIISSKGNVVGTIELEFEIAPKSISSYAFGTPQHSYEYTGTAIEPEIVIPGLEEGTDFTVSYSNNIETGDQTAIVTVTGVGNYQGTETRTFSISKKSISSYDIELSQTTYTYDGSEKKPEVKIEGLIEGKDYTVGYYDNVNVGTGEVVIQGIGNYRGTVTRTFSISAKSITNCDIKLSQTTYTYDGSEKKPEVKIEGLIEGKDYTVGYYENIDAGTGKVVIQGKGNYTEETAQIFTIHPAQAASVEASLDFTTVIYNGSTRLPSVTVKDETGNELYKNLDYTLSYKNEYSKNVGRYYVEITFTKNYTGSKKLYYMILPKAPASSSAVLYGHNDVKFSWKSSPGATGYNVYYKKPGSSKFTYLGATTNLYYKKANLADGKQYTFKVVPYYKYDGKKYESSKSKTATIYTLKKISKPVITKVNAKKIKVKWTNINGETGYQISKAASAAKTNIVSTYKTTTGNNINLTVTKGKTYYYKVRAYKTVDGKKIFGPWSEVKKFKL